MRGLLSLPRVRQVLGLARHALNPGGRLVTLDGCVVRGQSAVSRLLLKYDRGRFVRDEAGYTALAREAFPRVAVHIRHDLMRIPYTHIILECAG